MIRGLLEAFSGVSFRRGLSLGALVGAAIAGSTIWARFRAARGRSVSGTPDRTE